MKTKQTSVLITLCALCVLSLFAMLILLLQSRKSPEAPYAPPPFDAAARSGFPAPPEGLGFSPLSIEQGFTAYVCGNLTVKEDGSLPVYFTSPESNTVWLRLRISDGEGSLLAETGIIKPGEYVEAVKLSPVPKTQIPVNLKIIACRPDTYISMGAAGLNTVLNLEQ